MKIQILKYSVNIDAFYRYFAKKKALPEGSA